MDHHTTLPAMAMAMAACLGLAGCGDSTDVPADGGDLEGPRECRVERGETCSPGAGSTVELEVRSLGFASFDDDEDPGPIDGFDLDCRVSDRDDLEGCFVEDHVAHDGQPGIDNAMGASLDFIGIDVDPARVPALTIRVTGIADESEDDCVAVSLIDAESGRVLGESSHASIVDGELHALMSRTELTLPLVTASDTDPAPVDAPLVLTLEEPHLSLDMTADRPAGLLGGHADGQALIDAFSDAFGDTFPEDTIRALVEGQADISPDAEGNCDDLSAALTLGTSRP